MNHINVVLQDFDTSVDYLRKLYGAELIADGPQREWHACLIEMGRVIFEIFVPHEFLLNSRYGPHYIGIEYQADMSVVRKVVAARGIRIVRDIGIALHTHPADCFGVAFEFWDGYFHDSHWPLLGGQMKSAEYWRNEHALGLTGLKAYTVGVFDIEAASAFFQNFLGATPVYEAPRAAMVARAIGLRVADAVVELVAPVDDGPLLRHLHRYGEGIRSTVFGVRDVGKAQRYFTVRGIDVAPGTAADAISVPAGANFGVIVEFAE